MAPQDTPPIPVHVAVGNSFLHGTPADADPPVGWCRTSYPSLWCTCGACLLTWGYDPGMLAPGQRLTAYATTRVFVHAASPRDGSGMLCTTVRGELVCACGYYAMVWDPREE